MNRFRPIGLWADIVSVLTVAVFCSATPALAKQCSAEQDWGGDHPNFGYQQISGMADRDVVADLNARRLGISCIASEKRIC